MRRLRAVVVVGLTAVVPLYAHAAELTRVASSFDEGHPFGLFVDLGFERTQRLESIVREIHTGPPDNLLTTAPALRYASQDLRLSLDLHAGLWHDVEFHYGIPLIFAQSEEWWNSSAPGATGINTCVRADGTLLNPSCGMTGNGAVSMFPTSTPTPPIGTTSGTPQVQRGGFGNMRFGLSWAAFNQVRDETKPTWVVGLEYEAPTADRLDPSVLTSDTSRGAIGDRIHKYQLWSSFSRRVGVVDPYVKVNVTLPYRGPAWYSNCDNPDPTRMGAAANCGLTEWSRDATGIQAPYNAGITAGSEFVVFDQPAKKQRFTVDARAYTTYFSPGRYYNELSGLTHKLMYSGDYVRVGGSIALLAGVADYLTLRARATLSYESDHALSNESIVNCIPDPNATVVVNVCENNLDQYVVANPDKVNPNFDYRMDLVGRQLRATAVYLFNVQISASFNF